MGSSYMNFKNFGEAPLEEGGERPPNGNFPLARQSSVYSLTLDEFHSTFNGFGKDFGSMNMDELLKNIWTAEETQAMAAAAATSSVAREGNNNAAPSGGLPRQGSLTLPRTLSQKTVDEVWKDLFKGSTSVNEGVSNTGRGPFVQERQPTLGEITLEEFLSRAGVVREDTNPIARPNHNGFVTALPQQNHSNDHIGRSNHNGFRSDLSQPNQSNHGVLLGGQQPLNTTSGFQQNMTTPRPHQSLLQHQQQQLLRFPQQATTLAFASPVPPVSNGLVQGSVPQRDSVFEPVKVGVPSAGTFMNQSNVAFASSVPPMSYEMKSPVVSRVNGTFGQGSFVEKRPIGLNGLVNEKPMVKAGSPVNHLSSDRVANSNTDTSISPLPYMYNGGVRGRKGGAAMERATERRHKRMIKNRESAARSRARKQAYTLELEAEIDKLKELNQQLRKEQEEIIEMQKDKIMETVNRPWGSKRLSLRRTVTGPW